MTHIKEIPKGIPMPRLLKTYKETLSILYHLKMNPLSFEWTDFEEQTLKRLEEIIAELEKEG